MTDIACIIIACTLANHLGLIIKLEEIIHHRLPIVDCSKCFTFWSSLTFGLYIGTPLVRCLAISFMSAFIAVWLELLLSVIDYYYIKIYETYNTTDAADTTSATDIRPDDGDTASSLSELPSHLPTSHGREEQDTP